MGSSNKWKPGAQHLQSGFLRESLQVRLLFASKTADDLVAFGFDKAVVGIAATSPVPPSDRAKRIWVGMVPPDDESNGMLNQVAGWRRIEFRLTTGHAPTLIFATRCFWRTTGVGYLLMDKIPSVNDSLEELLSQLDPRMAAIGLACVSLTPGVAGQAGAVAAIAFDAKHKQWYGAALSAASIVPLAGYVPAVFKVGWLLRLLDRDLKKLEDQLPVLHQSQESIARLRKAFDKYYRNLPAIKIMRPLRDRLEHIMALDDSVQLVAAAEPGAGPVSNS